MTIAEEDAGVDTETARDAVRDAARTARDAATTLRTLSRDAKDDALRRIAVALRRDVDAIISANSDDTERARTDGTSPALIDRLTLTPRRGARLHPAQRSAGAPGACSVGSRRHDL